MFPLQAALGLWVCVALAAGCKQPPNPVCVAQADPGRADPADCAEQLGARCDTLGSPPTCKLPCQTDADCGRQALFLPTWQCIDGLCTDCEQDKARCLCHQHADCQSKVCDVYDSILPRPADNPAQPTDRAGRCIAQDLVLYVDNSSSGRCAASGSHTGRADDPFCSISDALALDPGRLPGDGGRRIIRVLGSNRSYGALLFADTMIAEPVFLFGPGQPHESDLPAKLNALSPPISLSGAFPLTVDGFYLDWLDSATLLSCNEQKAGQLPEIVIRRSYVTSDKSPTHKVAMTLNKCKLTLDSDWFDGIQGVGLLQLAKDSDTRITNSYFTDTVALSSAGVSVNLISIEMNASQFLFSHNTLAGNQPSPGMSSVVGCFMVSFPLDYSIFQGPDLVTGCSIQTSTLDPTSMVLDEASADATRPKYRLSSTRSTCCVDTAEAAPAVKWDYFGHRRPLPGSSVVPSVLNADKGAEELLPAM